MAGCDLIGLVPEPLECRFCAQLWAIEGTVRPGKRWNELKDLP